MKFRTKIMVCMVCILALLFGIGGSLMITDSFSRSLERERELAFRSYQMVLSTLSVVNGVNGGLEYEDISGTLSQLSAQNRSAWAGLRLSSPESGEIVYADGDQDAVGQSPPVELGRCVLTLSGGEAARCLQLSGALTAGDQTLRLDVGYDISALYAVRRFQRTAFRRMFLIMAALCMAVSYGSAFLLTRPLGKLSRASRKIADGNLSFRPKITSTDEIGAVAADFSRMADALEGNIRALEESVARQDRFMGSFAHELKTPMTSIIGYADLLRAQTLPPEEQMEAANYIFSEGKRLEALSLKLLDLLVLQQGTELTAASPGVVARDVAAHLTPVYRERGVRLTCVCEAGRCRLEPDLFRSLLLNLLDNARKAMDGGGEILLAVGMLPDGCRVTVQDSGRGIPPEALTHLTEAFYRVDKSRSRSQGGAGLGLALCREIIRLHDGDIRFESRPGAGTRVTVDLRGGRG